MSWHTDRTPTTMHVTPIQLWIQLLFYFYFHRLKKSLHLLLTDVLTVAQVTVITSVLVIAACAEGLPDSKGCVLNYLCCLYQMGICLQYRHFVYQCWVQFWGNRMYMSMLSAFEHCLSRFFFPKIPSMSKLCAMKAYMFWRLYRCTGIHLSLHYDMWACPVWGCYKHIQSLCSIEDVG